MTYAWPVNAGMEDGTVRLDEMRVWLEAKQARGVKQVRVKTLLGLLPGGGDTLMGSREAAEALQVPRPNIARLRKEGVLPEPLAELAAGPVWLRSQIDQAREEVERRRKVPAADREAERQASAERRAGRKRERRTAA